MKEKKNKNEWWRNLKIYLNPINWLFLIALYYAFKRGKG